MITVRVKAAGDLRNHLVPYLAAAEASARGAAKAEAEVRLAARGESGAENAGGVCVGDLLFALGLRAAAAGPGPEGVAAVFHAPSGPFSSVGVVGLILVNGKWSQPGDVLKDGDVVALYPPVGGGAPDGVPDSAPDGAPDGCRSSNQQAVWRQG